MQVIIPPKAKADFEQWLKKYWYVIMSISFQSLPFEMQQGVYLEYLRENGLQAEARPDFTKPAPYCSVRVWVIKSGDHLDIPDKSEPDYNTALAAAINAAFLRVEETLNALEL